MPGSIEPFLRAIGRLTVNFNAAEQSLRRFCWMLIDPSNEEVGHAITSGLSAFQLESLAGALVKKRKIDANDQKQIAKTLERFASVRSKRNQLLHAIWRIPNEASDLSEISAATFRLNREQSYAEVPNSNNATSIEDCAFDAFEVVEMFDELLDVVSGIDFSR